MRVELRFDSNCVEPYVVVISSGFTQEIEDLLQRLSDTTIDKCVQAYQGEKDVFLKLPDILRVYAKNGKVFAETMDGVYVLRQRLYELEKSLQPYHFVRISYSEIVNLTKVKKFDLSLSATILVIFENGAVSFVSRRYVKEIKNRICL